MTELIYRQEYFDIVGCAMKVHQELGRGFSEAVYQEALAIEFNIKGIIFSKECELFVYYRGEKLKKCFTADFICYNKIIIETKALSELAKEHDAQVINYLKATKFRLGILINFGTNSLTHKRLVNFMDF